MSYDAGYPHEGPEIAKRRSCWDRLRFWLFRDSLTIDEQTTQFKQKVEALKRASRELDQEISKVTQEDALRSLVISMNKMGRH